MFKRHLSAILALLLITSTASAVPPTISVSWDETPAPQQPDDYEIDTSDPDFPNIELKSESLTWCIYSTDSDNPNSIGDIGVISSPHPENFGVKIQNNSAGAGARVVKGIVLDPTNASNYSNLTGGSTTGNLEGDLLLQQSSGGTGGEVAGTFSLGGVISSAEITIPVVKATFSVDGSLTCPLTISDEIDAATLSIDSNVGSTGSITIADMIGADSQLTIGGNVAGDIVLETGIKSGHVVSIIGFLASNGSIDLNNANVAGTFTIVEGGAGVILDGGEVSANAVIQLGNSAAFSGTATFASIAQFGDLEVAGTHLEGTFRITGNVAGSVGIRGGDLKSTGKIQIDGSLTSTGDVIVEKGNDGVFGNALGDILVAGACAGDIHVDADVEGDIDLDSTMSGTISIDESLNSSGRILITGSCTGPITIEQQTVANSLIYLSTGLGSGGTSTINNGGGVYAANGSIRVGPVSTTPPLGDVTFDGSIMIVDGPSSGGDLNGTIEVVGCHATSDDLDICICGNNNGTVSIVQSSCSNQVDWSCVSGCP